VGGAAFLLAACAAYEPLPLATHAPLKHKLSELVHSGIPRIDKPLTVYEVAVLAVENNPDLIATRTQRGVARAQVLEAGLLPNPSITASYGFLLNPTVGGALFDAFNAGITQDIQKSITLTGRLRTAKAAALQVDASMLWEEWQLIGKARLLVFDIVQGEKLRRVLSDYTNTLKDRFERGRQALGQGNTTLSTVAPDLQAVGETRKELNDLERDLASHRQDLNALLGLSPEVVVPLSTNLQALAVDSKAVMQALSDIANRRPDLIALQLGYRSQDEKFRGAIIGQFPALTFGPSVARDTSDVRTFGPGITMDLPIFDRNQGNIAIERATREQLRAEFQARLSAAQSEVLGALATMKLISRQLEEERAELPVLQGFANQGEAAMNAGNLTERDYVDLVSANYAKKRDVLQLEQLLLEQEVQIATLIGAGMPRATMPTEAAYEREMAILQDVVPAERPVTRALATQDVLSAEKPVTQALATHQDVVSAEKPVRHRLATRQDVVSAEKPVTHPLATHQDVVSEEKPVADAEPITAMYEQLHGMVSELFGKLPGAEALPPQAPVSSGRPGR
jgi:outer membrane protein TolC